MLARGWVLAAFAALSCHYVIGKPFTLMDKITTQCELEALSVGTRLADHYNSYDEDTEWDTRIHNDYLVEHLGFAGWIQMGLYKNTKLTAGRQNAPALHQVRNIPVLSPLSPTQFKFVTLERRLGREQEYIRVSLLGIAKPVGVHDGRLDPTTSMGYFRLAVSKYVRNNHFQTHVCVSVM